jgi:hypothetical protein
MKILYSVRAVPLDKENPEIVVRIEKIMKEGRTESALFPLARKNKK